MLISRCSKGLNLAAVLMAFVVIQPGLLSGQNSGVAGDGTVRLMWRSTEGMLSIWKLDASNSMNYITGHDYGPYFGWEPIALTTANNGNSYALWRHTDGRVKLWLVDANTRYVTSREYGPYVGWIGVSLSVDTTAGKNRFRLVWRDTNGAVSVYLLDPNLNFVSNYFHKNSKGWTPSPALVAAPNSADAEVDARAAAAMATPSMAAPMPGQ